MGNVCASSLAHNTMSSKTASPLIKPDEPPVVSKDTSESNTDQNPGTLQDLHKKCIDVFPTTIFEGAKLMVNKALSSHFQISHTLNMSSGSPSGYRFGVMYDGTNQISPTKAFPLLFGDIDPSGNMTASIVHQHKNITAKFAAQVLDNRFVATRFITDLKGLNYTASATLDNIDILHGSGITILHYLQNVTPSLALGAEMAYQYSSQICHNEIAMSLAGRYTGKDYIASGTLNRKAVHACYYRKINENMQVGVEVKTDLRHRESICGLGYQFDLPKGNFVFKGMVDSNWTVAAMIGKKINPLPVTLVLNFMKNYARGPSRFGIGVIIN